MTTAGLPVLGITIGDVSGIGPEITVKALLRHPDLRRACQPIAIGDPEVLARAAALVGEDPRAVRGIDRPSAALNQDHTIDVIREGGPLAGIPAGVLSAEAGDAAVRYVKRACALARAGEIDGIVTAPLNKEAMHLAGHPWPGHTELLAQEFGATRYNLVLSARSLHVFHLSTHVSLRQAIAAITRERVLAIIELAERFARATGQEPRTIAVAGLNPHAGEHGLFGTEERDTIAPAIEEARARGADVAGPFAADALFAAAVRGKYHFVVVCYHDQGHAPFKAVYGDAGVNITVGLPVVRVSVDHGTAFDIAGRGLAREASLVLAIRRAAELAFRWRHLAP